MISWSLCISCWRLDRALFSARLAVLFWPSFANTITKKRHSTDIQQIAFHNVWRQKGTKLLPCMERKTLESVMLSLTVSVRGEIKYFATFWLCRYRYLFALFLGSNHNERHCPWDWHPTSKHGCQLWLAAHERSSNWRQTRCWYIPPSYWYVFTGHSFSELTFLSGRTGRFGRKGISINFVHDKRTWLQMEQIEKELGAKIMRIETNDLDEMEEVGLRDILLECTFFANANLLA